MIVNSCCKQNKLFVVLPPNRPAPGGPPEPIPNPEEPAPGGPPNPRPTPDRPAPGGPPTNW